MRWDEVPPEQRVTREEVATWAPLWLDRFDHPEWFCPIAVRPFLNDPRYLTCTVKSNGRLCARHSPGWKPLRHLPPHQFDIEVLAARRRWGIESDPALFTEVAERYQVAVLRMLIDSLQLDTSRPS